MLRRVASLTAAGVQVIVLLALATRAPAYDHENAAALAAMGATVMSATPDEFPAVLAAALTRS